MGKFCGIVGFVQTKETAPGVWTEDITEVKLLGDVLRNTKKVENGKQLNDNVVVDNLISVMANAYASQNFFAIRYVKWMGASWKVEKVEVQRPRLTLTLGGVYNGSTN